MLKKYTFYELLLISLVSAWFILYIDLTWLPFELPGLEKPEWINPAGIFIVRYTFLPCMIVTLVKMNLENLSFSTFNGRVLCSSLITDAFYAIWICCSFFPCKG